MMILTIKEALESNFTNQVSCSENKIRVMIADGTCAIIDFEGENYVACLEKKIADLENKKMQITIDYDKELVKIKKSTLNKYEDLLVFLNMIISFSYSVEADQWIIRGEHNKKLKVKVTKDN